MSPLNVRTVGLLAVTVRTDTKPVFSVEPRRSFGLGVGRGFKGGCITPIVCDVCGLPFRRCQCLAGVDY